MERKSSKIMNSITVPSIFDYEKITILVDDWLFPDGNIYWVKHYKEHVAHYVRTDDATFIRTIEEHIKKYKEAKAFDRKIDRLLNEES